MKQTLLYAKEENGELVFSNKGELAEFLALNPRKTFTVMIKRVTGIRSDDQNRALHLWFGMVATALNEAGLSIQAILSKAVDVDWDKDSVKEMLWRPAQKKIVHKESTTQLDKVDDITTVWEHLNRHLGEKFGIHVPFPVDEKKQADKMRYGV